MHGMNGNIWSALCALILKSVFVFVIYFESWSQWIEPTEQLDQSIAPQLAKLNISKDGAIALDSRANVKK